MATPFEDRRGINRPRADGRRRRFPRVQVTCDAYCEGDGRIRFGTASNLTLRGLRLTTCLPLDQGTEVTLRLKLPGSAQMLKASALVVWSSSHEERKRSGMGLRFQGLGASQLKRIGAFLLRTAGFPVFPTLQTAPTR